MSSVSDHNYRESSPEASSDADSRRRTRKRRRLGSVDPARARRYEVEGKYNDNYRVLFNRHVTRAAARFQVDESVQHYSNQTGASTWSSREQATFFAALARLGKDNVPDMARAIGTKSEPETRDFLLLLQDAATKQGDAKVTLADLPAAVELGDGCSQRMDEAAEALAWYQERFEATQEQQRYGDYWLITPHLADDIEAAINGLMPCRPASPATATVSEAEPLRRGRARTCTLCKMQKRKCDRGTPCSYCANHQADCVYTNSPPKDADRVGNDSTTRQLLDTIPQARLLQPQVMLALSKHLFMNRSPDIPSPWPHWSEYKSELAQEPSIYRTAFNDFHSLAISLTKRLVQTAIIQATSRLRAQRPRTNKGLSPFVRRRDVITAIDVLGLKRNGSERWRGVPRRCGLRVLGGRRSRQSRHRTELSWRDVERMLASDTPLDETYTADAETTAEPEVFQSRAARSGTPLSIQHLTLSDSDDDTEDGGDDREEPDNEHLTDEDQHQAQLYTLEEFDQKASQEEERALWDMFGLDPSRNDEPVKRHGYTEGLEIRTGEKIITEPGNWRSSVTYRAAWEEFHRPPPAAKFLANQKPLPMPATHATQSYSSQASSNVSKVSLSSGSGKRRRRRKSPDEIELRAQGTNAYAAVRGKGFELLEQLNSSSGDDEEMEADIPTQSIEIEDEGTQLEGSEDHMELN